MLVRWCAVSYIFVWKSIWRWIFKFFVLTQLARDGFLHISKHFDFLKFSFFFTFLLIRFFFVVFSYALSHRHRDFVNLDYRKHIQTHTCDYFTSSNIYNSCSKHVTLDKYFIYGTANEKRERDVIERAKGKGKGKLNESWRCQEKEINRE